MSKENMYSGYAAEARVATRLLDLGWPCFVDIVPSEIDLITQDPTCGHLISLQIKLAHFDGKTYSFHAGEYSLVDYYGVVWEEDFVWNITWIPTSWIEANSHAGLTKELKETFTTLYPTCLNKEHE